MYSRTQDLLSHSWQSQANLSFFLSLLILLGFVLPSFGFERSNLPLYADIAFCVISVAGAAIAWENRRLFVLTSLVGIVAIALRWVAWRKPTNTLILWVHPHTLPPSSQLVQDIASKPKHTMSPAARRKIAAFQRARWAKVKAQQKKAV
jgi:hypothetical protein